MSLIGPEGRRQLQLFARFAAAGFELAIAIVVGYFGGQFLDRWLGTAPVCGYVGLILGIVAGFRNLFLLARTANKSSLDSPSENDPQATETEPRDTAHPPDEKPPT